MTGSKAPFVVATALMIGAQTLLGQDVGDRVRVTTEAGSQAIGRIVEVRSSGFDLGMAGGQAGSFVRAEILRLERSLGSRSRWTEGLLYGGGGAFVAGFTVATTLISTTCDVVTLGTATEECTEDGFGVALAFAAIWGAVGGALGMGVGALMRGPERWEQIRLGDVDAGFRPIFDLRWDRGHPSAVVGARLRL